ncbi:MAG: hypothetical protein ABSG86_13240 [Thermoguttaceae bacterium]|jgi:hypothetical protein
MPRAKRPFSYRLHRARNCAVVTIKGHNHYLGACGSPESYGEYAQFIATWQAGVVQGAESPKQGRAERESSINELILAYWQSAKSHYVKDGKPTDTLIGIRSALRPLRTIFGSTPASELGPKNLKTIRHQFIEAGLSRGVVNKRAGQNTTTIWGSGGAARRCTRPARAENGAHV